MRESNKMAKKDTKTKELRVRLPEQHHAILEEYCEVYGQTPSSTICGYIVEDLWQALARTREVVVKFNNFTPNYSPVTQIAEKSLSKKARSNSKKKIPEDFDPPREISETHGLDHEKAVTAFKDWALSKGHKYVDWEACYRNACRGWLGEKFEGARKQLHQGVKVI